MPSGEMRIEDGGIAGRWRDYDPQVDSLKECSSYKRFLRMIGRVSTTLTILQVKDVLVL